MKQLVKTLQGREINGDTVLLGNEEGLLFISAPETLEEWYADQALRRDYGENGEDSADI